MGERGQGTVEWVGLIAIVSLALAVMIAAGIRVPGATLAKALASRLVCAAALARDCEREPALIAVYGTEVGHLVADHMPSLGFEAGSRALPVDFRRCRVSACADGKEEGEVFGSDAGHPVTAFVHVVDCRDGAWAGSPSPAVAADCSGPRAGNLYIQYWLYYADSASLRGVPVVADSAYHPDDWESVQVRIGADGRVSQRASSHNGYNHARSLANVGSDAGIGPLRVLAEAVGVRPRNGWGAAASFLLVSGGSHAGNLGDGEGVVRMTPADRVRLLPLEQIAAQSGRYRFAVTPPWRKRVWTDPEATGTR